MPREESTALLPMRIIESAFSFTLQGANGSSKQARRIEMSTVSMIGAATTRGSKNRTISRRGRLREQRGALLLMLIRRFLVSLSVLVASVALCYSGSHWYFQGNSFDYTKGKEGYSSFSSSVDSHSLAPTDEEGFLSLDLSLGIFSDSIVDPTHVLASISTSLFSSTLKQSFIFSFVPFAIAGRPRRRGIHGPATPPPAFTVPPYSLSTACANEIQKWCLYRTPYTQEAIDCFESHKTELSATCLKWHNARISCQSQIGERVRLALMPPGSSLLGRLRRGDEGEGGKNENDNNVDALGVKGFVQREREPPQRRAERLDVDDNRREAAHAENGEGYRNNDHHNDSPTRGVGGGGGGGRPVDDGENEVNDYFDALPNQRNDRRGRREVRTKDEAIVDAQRLRGAALSSNDATGEHRHCGSICQTYCGASKSLLLCMRVLGKSIQQVTDPSCYDTDFARSIVRSLNKKG